MNTKHGFLTLDAGSTALFVDNHIWNPPYTKRPSGLVNMAHQAGLTHLWVLPDYPMIFAPDGTVWQDSKGKRGKLVTPFYDLLLYMGDLKDRPARPVASITGHADRKKNVSVIFLSQTDWDYTGLDAFRSFVEDAEQRLGVPMKASSVSVGLRYLETLLSPDVYADPGIEKQAMPAMFKNAADSLKVFRQPTPEELSKPYLVAYDKRAAFPRGAQEERFGVGKAIYQEGGEFNPALAGLWYGTVSGLENLPPLLLPVLWDKANPEEDGLTTPVVKALLKLGCQFDLHGAFVWPDSRKIFEKWVKNLWKLRESGHEEYKSVMNNTIGFFANTDKPEDKLCRPDWFQTTVGSNRGLVLHNIIKFAEITGLWPVGAWIDAVYYFSDTPEIAPIGLQSNSLGGYAYKWTIEVDDAVRALLTDPAELALPNMLIGKLNRMVEGTDNNE